MPQHMSGSVPGGPDFYVPTIGEQSPEWGKWLDMLNAAAPGGITSQQGQPGQQTLAPMGSPLDPLSHSYDPAMLAKLSMRQKAKPPVEND